MVEWESNRRLKLSGAGRFIYEFKKCKPNQYQYAVDYIGNKSNIQRKEYESFLDDIDINYYEMPLNIWQFSIGRVKFRSYANRGGKIATSSGMINRELLILERENNGKPFNIYSNVKDKIMSLKERRKPHIYLLIFMVLMELYNDFIGKPFIDISYFSNRNSLDKNTLSIFLGIIAIISMVRIVRLSLLIKTLNKKTSIQQ